LALPIPVGANQLRFPGVLSLTVTAQVYVPSLFCEQLLEVWSILTGATCITGVGVGDGDRVGDGVGEGDGVGDGVGEGDGIDVGDGDTVGDGDGEGVGVLPGSNVSVTGMVTLPPFE
jgi:hypothetical protein